MTPAPTATRPKTKTKTSHAADSDEATAAAQPAAAPQSPAPASAEEPLVDLDDIAPKRPTVRKGGVLYELAILDDFGISDQQALTRDGREFFRLWSSEQELAKTERQRLEMLLKRMFARVLELPDEVTLTDGEKAQVVLGFTLAPLAQRTAQTQQDQAGDSSTTAS